MLCSEEFLQAYGSDDTSVSASYSCRSVDNRKKLTDELISEDRTTFKKFIKVIEHYYDIGAVKESPEQLLQINIDKFLNDDVVEYI